LVSCCLSSLSLKNRESIMGCQQNKAIEARELAEATKTIRTLRSQRLSRATNNAAKNTATITEAGAIDKNDPELAGVRKERGFTHTLICASGQRCFCKEFFPCEYCA